MSRNGGGYYAVANGRKTGIYNSWNECKSQTDGYAGSKFKKFNTEAEARSFVSNSQSAARNDYTPSYGYSSRYDSSYNYSPSYGSSYNYSPSYGSSCNYSRNYNCSSASTSGSSNWEDIGKSDDSYKYESTSKPRKVNESKRLNMKLPSTKPNPNCVSIYTDGACESNGRHGASGGIGVYWGPDHRLNVSEPLTGRQTNNRAEIHAAIRAVDQAKAEGLKEINLHTDSQFLINSNSGITGWVNKWKKNDWKLSTGGPVKNKEDFQQLDESLKGVKVNWVHVKGHSGIAGNEAADELARNAVPKSRY